MVITLNQMKPARNNSYVRKKLGLPAIQENVIVEKENKSEETPKAEVEKAEVEEEVKEETSEEEPKTE